jgi:hypothetical protein
MGEEDQSIRRLSDCRNYEAASNIKWRYLGESGP